MKKLRGFTLIELIMVIVIIGIIAATLLIFLRPAIQSYVDTRRRAELTDMADTALRRMAQDIRSAVPNSLRQAAPDCFQLVPTSTGGRYRMAPDTTSGDSAALDTSTTTLSFDVLNTMRAIPAAGDWVVVDNQNGDDVYNGVNRASIRSVSTPSPGGAAVGQHRIVLSSATQFPTGYQEGRFVVVPQAEQSVTYTCNGGVLYRVAAQDFGAPKCAPPANSPIAATGVSRCLFNYVPNQGATEQSGYIEMQLSLSRDGDTVTLLHGVHVENAP